MCRKNSLLSKVFQSGKSEALPESTKEKIEQQKNEFISTSYVGNSKFLTEAIRSSKRNVLGLKNTVSTLEKSLVQIATLEVPADKEQVKTRSKGRQKKTNPVPVKGKEYRSSPKDQCSCCGSHMVTVGEMTEQIRSQVKAIEKQCTILEQHHDLQICPKCGKAHVVMPADCDHPILPNRTISTHSVIEYAHWLSLGLPLQKKSSAQMNNFFELGSDTLHYSLRDLNRIYLAPYVAAIQAQAQKEEIIVADETAFPVLEAQGKGHRGKKPVVENPKSTNYAFALGSAPGSATP